MPLMPAQEISRPQGAVRQRDGRFAGAADFHRQYELEATIGLTRLRHVP